MPSIACLISKACQWSIKLCLTAEYDLIQRTAKHVKEWTICMIKFFGKNLWIIEVFR